VEGDKASVMASGDEDSVGGLRRLTERLLKLIFEARLCGSVICPLAARLMRIG
jgi:hypothetical protein